MISFQIKLTICFLIFTSLLKFLIKALKIETFKYLTRIVVLCDVISFQQE